MIIERNQFQSIRYYVANADKNNLPVIVHVHGAGSRGDDLQIAIDANPQLKFFESHPDFPQFKIYAPQCHANTWFDLFEQLSAFVEWVKQTENTDKIFLTGMSMGGYTSWQLLASKPDLFKKAIICCGGGMYWNAGRIKTPVRAFHGKLDDTVYYEESVKMVDAVNRTGGNAELITCETLGHDCWSRAFLDEESYLLLLR